MEKSVRTADPECAVALENDADTDAAAPRNDSVLLHVVTDGDDGFRSHTREIQSAFPGGGEMFAPFHHIGSENATEKLRIVRELEAGPAPGEEVLLPFFIAENALEHVREALREYVKKGGRVIRISSLSHLSLVKEFPGVVVKSCMPMPICNSMAVQEAAVRGIAMVQAWLELERTELEAMISKSVLPVEIYQYGRPPLLSTRAEIAAGDRMTDLRGETFLVEHTGDLTQILSEKVMSIPPLRGAAAGLYDLRHAVLHEKKTSRFNFDFRLE